MKKQENNSADGPLKKPLFLSPGTVLDPEILSQLHHANTLKKRKSTSWYQEKIAEIFSLKPSKVQRDHCTFLGGFIVAQGSLNASAKKTGKFGLVIDPEFSLTQHVNGVNVLYSALQVFQTGTIRHKSGSNATLVFRIGSRESLRQKCIPFCEKYSAIYAGEEWKRRVGLHKRLLQFFVDGAHKDLSSFTGKILPLWDQIRHSSHAGFYSLEQAVTYVREENKFNMNKYGSSETTRDPA